MRSHAPGFLIRRPNNEVAHRKRPSHVDDVRFHEDGSWLLCKLQPSKLSDSHGMFEACDPTQNLPTEKISHYQKRLESLRHSGNACRRQCTRVSRSKPRRCLSSTRCRFAIQSKGKAMVETDSGKELSHHCHAVAPSTPWNHLL